MPAVKSCREWTVIEHQMCVYVDVFQERALLQEDVQDDDIEHKYDDASQVSMSSIIQLYVISHIVLYAMLLYSIYITCHTIFRIRTRPIWIPSLWLLQMIWIQPMTRYNMIYDMI